MALARMAGFSAPEIRKDLGGVDRALVLRYG
jgi:hypothetical protein